jgi:hypothetical protein
MWFIHQLGYHAESMMVTECLQNFFEQFCVKLNRLEGSGFCVA